MKLIITLINQGIFYNGQIWNAYEFINKLLKSVKKRGNFDR